MRPDFPMVASETPLCSSTESDLRRSLERRREEGGIGDLGDEICRRGLADAIDEHSQKWNLQEEVKPHAKTKEQTFPVAKPPSPLLWRKFDS